MIPWPQLAVASICFGTANAIRQYKKIRKLRHRNAVLAEAVMKNIQWSLYLAELLDRHGVEVTEFDKIAINQTLLDFQNLAEESP
jgi:hypothetical protein